MRLQQIKPAAFCGIAEEVAILKKINAKGGEVPAIMSEATARQLLANRQLLKNIPEIKNISDCPVLVKNADGNLEAVTGYHAGSKVYAQGAPPVEMSHAEGVNLILGLLDDFKTSSEADKSRMLALMLSPALIHGGILDARVPLFIIEGDIPGCGKGTAARLASAIYKADYATITMRKGGVGSFDESLGAAYLSGKGFILIDNFRGALKSQVFESAMTEPVTQVRQPYQGNVFLDVSRFINVITSNGLEMTPDLARRTMAIRLKKQPDNFPFKHIDIVKHVEQNQPKYLGAVFSIIKYWYSCGADTSKISLPSYTEWARCLDCIIKNIMFMPPILEGNQGAIERMSNPALSWLREVALHIVRKKILGDLSTTAIVKEIEGSVLIPGLQVDEQLNTDTMQKANIATGVHIGKAFRDDDEVIIDGLKIQRLKKWSSTRNELKTYKFSKG
ncbi:MAG: hypothetical protein U9N63_14820 [Pseudomonadota bacterium]|nr:hypothetical protein [Pseudomonadota bacterium]